MRNAVSKSLCFYFLACVALVHSAFLFVWWLSATSGDRFRFEGKTWVMLVWLWVVWPVVLALCPGTSLLRWLIVTVIGLAFLLPCAETILVFTLWSLRGFAP